VSFGADLEGFVHDHRSHGPLTADATAPAWNGYRLTVACPCGVVFKRWRYRKTPERDRRFVALQHLAIGPSWRRACLDGHKRSMRSSGGRPRSIRPLVSYCLGAIPICCVTA
jgi:hypothetical protein